MRCPWAWRPQQAHGCQAGPSEDLAQDPVPPTGQRSLPSQRGPQGLENSTQGMQTAWVHAEGNPQADQVVSLCPPTCFGAPLEARGGRWWRGLARLCSSPEPHKSALFLRGCPFRRSTDLPPRPLTLKVGQEGREGLHELDHKCWPWGHRQDRLL